MTLQLSASEIISNLSNYSCFPNTTEEQPVVKVVQTHLSIVFLVGEYVYKVKKPVNFGWVDYSTLKKRTALCALEVSLNHRLAPDVYLGVVLIYRNKSSGKFIVSDQLLSSAELEQIQSGKLSQFESDDNEVVEIAVQMQRLRDQDTLLHAVRTGTVSSDTIDHLASKLASFHTSERCNPLGTEEAASSSQSFHSNMMSNFVETESHIGQIVSKQVYDEVRLRSMNQFDTLVAAMNDRACESLVRDCHGDLKLEHVYLLNDSFTIIDCIEFNKSFRTNDVFCDAAFISMDLHFEGRADLSARFSQTYLMHWARNQRDTGIPTDEEVQLFHHFEAYRAIVRAKVLGLKVLEPEIPLRERNEAQLQASALWNVARHFLRPCSNRPVLLIMAGLPGSGKSTVAQGLVTVARDPELVKLVRSDVIRKQLAGLKESESGKENATLYSKDHTSRTFEEICRIVLDDLKAGNRVIVDATFTDLQLRAKFIRMGIDNGVTTMLLDCTCSRQVTEERLKNRKGDVSDADFAVYEKLENVLASQGGRGGLEPRLLPLQFEVPTERSKQDIVESVIELIKSRGVEW